MRNLGVAAIRRAHRLDAPLLQMLLNATHDHHGGRVFVLQVGAGDGEGGLPLLHRFRDDGWSGLLIEPHPDHFTSLEALHADSERVAVLNLGISDVSANLTLYSLAPEADARLPRGRASLLRDRIAAPGLAEGAIQATDIPVLRMDTVLGELGIDSAQLLVINAGGHEEQILRGFDPAALDPSLVLVAATPGTSADAATIAALETAGLQPFRIEKWLVGIAPGRLSAPLDELLTFFQKGVTAPLGDEE
jgi:FkbM family methyltransferase